MKARKLSRALVLPVVLAVILAAMPAASLPVAAYPLELDCVSAILMEAETGTVLYEQNADERLPPASVTKVMTLLLVMEAIADNKLSLSDPVQVSEHAASMGGSQIYLEPGETMTAEDLIKAVVISSANDAAVALAEHLAGSEEGFVARMNERAAELGMVNTTFENTNGLDDTTEAHLTTARDIAVMSRELISHPKILEYSSTWMDTVRDGAFGLTNTNRLIRFYNGANGLKTGSTSKARYCISATAKRGDMQLIAVIMAAPTRDIRNEAAKKLLDYGFANYSFVELRPAECGEIPVVGGKKESCRLVCDGVKMVVPKGSEGKIEKSVLLNESAIAPVAAGSELGTLTYLLNGEKLCETPIVAAENVDRISYGEILMKMMQIILEKS